MQQMVRLFPLKAEGEVADEGTLFFINIAFKNKNDVINKHEAEKKSLYVFFPPLISFTLNKAQLITLTYTFTTKGGGKTVAKHADIPRLHYGSKRFWRRFSRGFSRRF